MTSNIRLPFDAAPEPEPAESRIAARDRSGRARAVDPRYNVALEASAGTGKTRVLVDRYVNLLKAGVDPSNVLAITFTRKAAAEMRERIVATLRGAAATGEIPPARWRELRDRTAEIAISTIDAFCLSLLREFPLEADLDPGFSLADESEIPRLVDEALDRALRICRGAARDDEHVALVFAQLGERRARAGLAALLHRRLVAPRALARFLTRGPSDLTVASASRAAAESLLDVFAGMRGGLERFLETGPPEPPFLLLARDLRRLLAAVDGGTALDPAAVQAAFTRAREHVLTQDGQPRVRLSYARAQFTTDDHWRTHRDLVTGHGAALQRAWAGYRRDLNVLVSRGVWRMFRIAEDEYRRTLDAHAVLDFSDVLMRALDLLRQMEEFAQSRYRLESRYHHVLVDEFQDTSRAQWELVSLLIQSWGEGVGLAHAGPLPPSVFIVGDRKQSIYGFRDADASILQTASRHLDTLRPEGDVRRSMSRSFRALPGLLAFVNDVCQDMDVAAPGRPDAFRYEESDRFPLDDVRPADRGGLGLVLAETADGCAAATAIEIARLLASGATVRDRDTGVPRAARPGDIAILFRTRESHREFEDALERLDVPAYVYKGLGFFDADEIKDVLALLWYLGDPVSDLRAAALMRSRLIGLSDEGLRRLAPHLAEALRASTPPAEAASLDAIDASALAAARTATRGWRGRVDRMPPAELLDLILEESAYAVELRGRRFRQARENLKKIRGLVRRMQNRGYTTLGRIAAHLDRLAVGDEATAALDALDAVNLMTVHAAKGLEFPVVFVVNISRGTGNRRDPIRVTLDSSGESASVAVGDFQSDADEDVHAREAEESKRLLYVALTRARDQLYLASVLKDGRLQPGRGSLAEVLPASLRALLTAPVAVSGEPVEWRASSGAVHTLRVCRGDPVEMPASVQAPPVSSVDLLPIDDTAIPRLSVSSAVLADDEAPSPHGGRSADRLVGLLVHRLIERLGFGASDVATVRSAADGLLRLEDVGDPAERARLIDEASGMYNVVVQRKDVQAICSSGTAAYEVPFTMQTDGRWIRGSIDCLVRHASGGVTVLELKTGRPRPEHARQVEFYTRAAGLVFPGDPITARIVYVEAREPA